MAGEAGARVGFLSTFQLVCGERRAGIIREKSVSVCAGGEREGGCRERQEGEVKQAPAEAADAEDVHGGELDAVGAGKLLVAQLAVGGPAAAHEKDEVVEA